MKAEDWKATQAASGLMARVVLSPSTSYPSTSTLARKVSFPVRSRTKTSPKPLVSLATRLDALDWKATYWPSPLIAGSYPLAPFASVAPVLTLTRSVVPGIVARTKTSRIPFVSPVTRLSASDMKAMYVPSELMAGLSLMPLPCTSSESTLTRVVVPAVRSRRNTSLTPFESPVTKFVASEWNATYCPSPLMAAPSLDSFPSVSLESTLTRVVISDWVS